MKATRDFRARIQMTLLRRTTVKKGNTSVLLGDKDVVCFQRDEVIKLLHCGTSSFRSRYLCRHATRLDALRDEITAAKETTEALDWFIKIMKTNSGQSESSMLV